MKDVHTLHYELHKQHGKLLRSTKTTIALMEDMIDALDIGEYEIARQRVVMALRHLKEATKE